MKQLLAAVGSGILLILLLIYLKFPIGRETVPSIGDFFSERVGVWQTVRHSDLTEGDTYYSEALSDTVRIFRDRNGVPHIYAASKMDAIWAMGFIAAKDRLFELFLIPKLISGQSSEWFGADFVPVDQSFLNLGLEEAAWKHHNALSDSSYRLISQYKDGVNHYVQEQYKGQKPFFFKLKSFPFRFWRPVDTIRSLKFWYYMTRYSHRDLELQQALDDLGVRDFKRLFSSEVGSAKLATGTAADPSLISHMDDMAEQRYKVLGTRKHIFQTTTFSGFDSEQKPGSMGISLSSPLTLPSLFQEVHIVTPESNSYGITMPGVPALLYGFNDSMAWSLYYDGEDPADFYRFTADKESFSDELFKSKSYTISPSNSEDQQHKVSFYGNLPIIASDSDSLLLDWSALNYGNEIEQLANIQFSTNREQLVNTLSDYSGPNQNIMVHTRSEALKASLGEKTEHSVGIQRIVDYQLPQKSFGVTSDIMADGSFTSDLNDRKWREVRLSQLDDELTDMPISIDEVSMLLLDTKMPQSELMGVLERAVDEDIPSAVQELMNGLRVWDFKAGPNAGYVLFWDKFKIVLRKNILSHAQTDIIPSDVDLMRLLRRNSSNSLFDDPTTDTIEDGYDVVLQSLQEAFNLTQMEQGNMESWRWGAVTQIRSRHSSNMALLNNLSLTEMEMSGFLGTINPLPDRNRRYGASWRLVVDFTPSSPQGKIMSFSGNSANPFSPYFDSEVPSWKSNKFKQVNRTVNPESILEGSSMLFIAN